MFFIHGIISTTLETSLAPCEDPHHVITCLAVTNELASHLPLQMLLFFNVFYFPCWWFSSAFMLELKVSLRLPHCTAVSFRCLLKVGHAVRETSDEVTVPVPSGLECGSALGFIPTRQHLAEDGGSSGDTSKQGDGINCMCREEVMSLPQEGFTQCQLHYSAAGDIKSHSALKETSGPLLHLFVSLSGCAQILCVSVCIVESGHRLFSSPASISSSVIWPDTTRRCCSQG